MKKHIAIVLFLVVGICSCEKDDFCTKNPITPNLVLRFYDATNTTATKNVSSLYVWAEGKDSIYVNATTDSIAIPLNSASNNTVYYFSKGTSINKLTIDYTTDETYVSRSCGFKSIFNEVTFTSDTTWILNITPNSITTIDQQNSAHAQLFH